MTAPAPILPEYVTPAKLAEHFGVGERWVRDKAREIGACCIVGNNMVHLRHHVEMLLEAFQPCHTQSFSAGKSGTTGVPQPDGDYAELRAQRTKPARKGSQRKPKQNSGTVISMDRGRM